MCSESQFPAVPILWSGWRHLEEKDVTPDHVKTKIHSLTSDQAKLLETVLGDFVWITVGFFKVMWGYANDSFEIKLYRKYYGLLLWENSQSVYLEALLH